LDLIIIGGWICSGSGRIVCVVPSSVNAASVNSTSVYTTIINPPPIDATIVNATIVYASIVVSSVVIPAVINVTAIVDVNVVGPRSYQYIQDIPN